jgi:hypothetical protein
MPGIVDVGNLSKAELTILASEWLPRLLGDDKRYALLEGLCGEELRFNDKQPSPALLTYPQVPLLFSGLSTPSTEAV